MKTIPICTLQEMKDLSVLKLVIQDNIFTHVRYRYLIGRYVLRTFDQIVIVDKYSEKPMRFKKSVSSCWDR